MRSVACAHRRSARRGPGRGCALREPQRCTHAHVGRRRDAEATPRAARPPRAGCWPAGLGSGTLLVDCLVIHLGDSFVVLGHPVKLSAEAAAFRGKARTIVKYFPAHLGQALAALAQLGLGLSVRRGLGGRRAPQGLQLVRELAVLRAEDGLAGGRCRLAGLAQRRRRRLRPAPQP
eukprot:scaffold23224_cov31-Tisochrysis_lutea.AAC.6